MNKNDPNINKLIFSNYLIQAKIAKGSFGIVYSGKMLSNNHKIAIKLEKRRDDFPGILETEACRLHLLQGEGIPKIVCYGTNETHNILIQELLGSSLEKIFNKLNKKFSLKTVCNIGIQLIKRIKHIHKKYHIHRDLKPDNFLTGYYKIDSKIYLIDFGLSKKYYSTSKQKHIKFKKGYNLIGTARYCSRNAHKGYELSRRDDIESLGYCLIYFLKGKLPWQGLKVKRIEDQFEKIAEKKIGTSFEELTQNLPDEFLQYFKYCDKLEFEDEPDYEYLISLFKNVLDKFFVGEKLYEYDWNKNLKNYLNSKNNSSISRSRDVSLFINNNISNNISTFDGKLNNIIINDNNKNINEEKEDEKINNIYKNKEKNEDEIIYNDNDIDIINEEKNDKNYNKLRKIKQYIFLPPKKIEDYFPEDEAKNFEIFNTDICEKESNKDNNIDNLDNKDSINNINETKIEAEHEKENKELNIEKNKEINIEKSKDNNNIINNININININNEDTNKKYNMNNNNINNNLDNCNNNEKKDLIVYDYGIIESKTRNRYNKLEGNIDNKNVKDNIKCGCMIV